MEIRRELGELKSDILNDNKIYMGQSDNDLISLTLSTTSSPSSSLTIGALPTNNNCSAGLEAFEYEKNFNESNKNQGFIPNKLLLFKVENTLENQKPKILNNFEDENGEKVYLKTPCQWSRQGAFGNFSNNGTIADYYRNSLLKILGNQRKSKYQSILKKKPTRRKKKMVRISSKIQVCVAKSL